jgi:hypothetical protein
VKVAVRHVDRDALLPLRAQAVGEQRQVGVAVAALARGALDMLELVLEDRLGVEQQPAYERGLAVVDRPGGGEADELRGMRGERMAVRAGESGQK